MGLGAALDLAVNVAARGSSTEADKPKKADSLCWAGGDMLNCLKVTHICPHPDSGAGALDTMYLGRSWRAAAARSRGGRQRALPGSCLLVLALFAKKEKKKKPNHINTGREWFCWWLLAAFLHPFSPLRVPLDPSWKCYTE